MSFWLALAALTALALALLWLPLRRTQRDTAAATNDQLRRLREFDADLAAGDFDATVAPALRAELERAVLEALPEGMRHFGDGGFFADTMKAIARWGRAR